MGASWADHKSKDSSLWIVIFSYSAQQQQTISWLDCIMKQKVDFIWQPEMTSSVIGPRRSSKALPKAKLAPEKGHGHCLVVSDPLQLSESWQNHYLWEVCSANWWDAPKTAMTAASIDQQKGPKSSPWQRQTACCTTNTAKVEPIGLQSFASSVIFTWPFANCLPLLQASRQLFAGKILPQPAGCGKCFHHQKDELSKSSLNPKAWIFMLQE